MLMRLHRWLGVLRPREAGPQAEEAATRAIELDDRTRRKRTTQTRPHFCSTCWDFVRAERESARAIELDPNFAEAHHLHSYALNALNRTEEALKEQRKATELEPSGS